MGSQNCYGEQEHYLPFPLQKDVTMELFTTRVLVTPVWVPRDAVSLSPRQNSHIVGLSIHEQPKLFTQNARQTVSYSVYDLTLKR